MKQENTRHVSTLITAALNYFNFYVRAYTSLSAGKLVNAIFHPVDIFTSYIIVIRYFKKKYYFHKFIRHRQAVWIICKF